MIRERICVRSLAVELLLWQLGVAFTEGTVLPLFAGAFAGLHLLTLGSWWLRG